MAGKRQTQNEESDKLSPSFSYLYPNREGCRLKRFFTTGTIKL